MAEDDEWIGGAVHVQKGEEARNLQAWEKEEAFETSRAEGAKEAHAGHGEKEQEHEVGKDLDRIDERVSQ